MNNVATNTGIRTCSHFSCVRYLGVQLPGHMTILWWTFWRTARLFTSMVESFYISTSNVEGASLVAQTVKNLPAMWETRVQSLGQEDPLDMAMATHSSILAWRIPQTEKPGGLQSMGSQRVRHDWATNNFTFFSFSICICIRVIIFLHQCQHLLPMFLAIAMLADKM